MRVALWRTPQGAQPRDKHGRFASSDALTLDDQLKSAVRAGNLAYKQSQQSGYGNGAKHRRKEEAARRRSRDASKTKKKSSGRGRNIR